MYLLTGSAATIEASSNGNLVIEKKYPRSMAPTTNKKSIPVV